MQPKTPKLLADIHDAAAFIHTSANGRTLADYRDDRMFRQAIERNFEIIGEAVGRLARIDPEIAMQLGPYEQIIAFRNVLIHGYDMIEHERVWQVVVNDMPLLLKQAEQLLREIDRAR